MNPHDDREPFTAIARAMDQVAWAAHKALDRLGDELAYRHAGGVELDQQLSELDWVLRAKRGCRR